MLGLHCTPLVEDWSNQSWNTVLWLLLSRVHYLDVIRSISAISFLILASTHVSAPPIVPPPPTDEAERPREEQGLGWLKVPESVVPGGNQPHCLNTRVRGGSHSLPRP